MGWGTDTTGKKWIVRVNETGTLRAEVASGYVSGTTVLTDGNWHHIAVVFNNDGSPDISDTQLYVDGVPDVVQATLPRTIDTGATTNVRIGAYQGTSPRYFKGLIDEVQIYSSALSADKINYLYFKP